jgi:hypothetical protein
MLSSIRAGSDYVELFLKDNAFTRGLDRAQNKLKQWSDGLSKIGTDLIAVGLKISVPLGLAVRQFSNAGAGLFDMSQRTGIAVETFSGLEAAITGAGSSLEEFELANKKLGTAITLGIRGNQEAQEAFRALGVDVFRLAKQSPEQQLNDIADALAKVENPAARSALAMKVLGESSGRLMPLFSRGAAGLREFQAAAAPRGEVISGADAAKAKDFSLAMNSLWLGVKRAVFEIGSAVAPSLGSLARMLTTGAQAIAGFVRENQWLIKTTALLGASFLFDGLRAKVAAAALGVLGKAIGIVSASVRGLATVAGFIRSFASAATALTGSLGTVGSALTMLRSLVLLPIAAVKALAAAFAIAGTAAAAASTTLSFSSLLGLLPLAPLVLGAAGAFALFTSAGQSAARTVGGAMGTAFTGIKHAGSSAFNYLADVFNGVKERAVEAWGGISDALDAGEFGLAARIATTALEGEWIRFKNWFLDMWEDIVGKVTGWLNGIIGKAKDALESAQQSTAEGLATSQVSGEGNGGQALLNATPLGLVNNLFRDALGLQSAFNPNAPTASQVMPNLQPNGNSTRDRESREIADWFAAETSKVVAQMDRDAAAQSDIMVNWFDLQNRMVEASMAKEKADAARLRPPGRDLPSIDDSVMAKPKTDITGAFNAAALAGMGSSSIPERTVRAMEGTQKDIREVVRLVRGFPGAVFGA